MEIRCRNCGNSIFLLNPEVDGSSLFTPGFSAPPHGRRSRKRALGWLSLIINRPGI
jgi:hypothetical protein